MTRRRVYYLITDLDHGGAEKNLVNLATRLPPDLKVVGAGCLFAPHASADALRDAGIPVDCFEIRGWRDLLATRAVARRLRELRVDLLHTFLFHANMIGRVAGVLAGTPRVVSSVRVAETRRWHLWLDGLTQRLVDRESAVGQAVLEHTVRRAHVARRKLFRVPIGIDPVDAPPDRSARESCRILGVGRLHPQKRWEDLFVALERLKGHDWTCEIVGEGPARPALEARLASLGLTGRVSLPGYRAPIGPSYRDADLFVLPSSWEGMPNVVLEAMAHGLPVVATDVGATRELLTEATGILVPSHAPPRIAAALASLLDAPQRRLEMGAAGRARAHESFTIQVMIDRTVAVYRELLA